MLFRHMVCCLMLLVYSLLSHAANILVLGDSLSTGYGIDPKLGWVSLLQQRLQEQGYPQHVVNASISGETTSQGLTRLPALLVKHKPSIVIVALGGNDGLRGLPILAIRKNLSQMIELSQQQKAKILLLGVRLPPNYGEIYTERFHAVFKDLAKQKNTLLVPLFLAGVDDNSSLMQEDGIHPQVSAQPILLDNVWSILKELL